MRHGTATVGFLLSFVAGGTLCWGALKGSNDIPTHKEGAGSKATQALNKGAVRLDLFAMSQCPYGVQAEGILADVVKTLGADLDFHIDYIGQSTPDGQLSSLHGPKEVTGDLVQSCAMKEAPTKWFDLIQCQNQNSKEIDTNWRSCADKVGIDADALDKCANGPEGKALVEASFKRSLALGISSSPTIQIDGKPYSGNRRSSDILRAVCQAYTGEKPAACGSIPEAPKVNVTVLTDSRCKECDAKRIESAIHQKVGNPFVTIADYADPAGRKLFDSVKPQSLPAILFDSTLDADADAKAAFGRGAHESAGYRVVENGSWNPACANDGGCATPECALTMHCREQTTETPQKLELFVMSHCPFGVKALDAMHEVLDSFDESKAKVDFSIHYIPQGAPEALQSMHGPTEVEEDLREVCTMAHYPERRTYMDYIWCRNKDIKDGDWHSCTGGSTGIDPKVIETCSTGPEGKKLLVDSFEYAKKSGIGASPTWIANGRYQFSGIDAETVRSNVCNHNTLGAACDKKLSGPPARPAGAPAAAPKGCEAG